MKRSSTHPGVKHSDWGWESWLILFCYRQERTFQRSTLQHQNLTAGRLEMLNGDNLMHTAGILRRRVKILTSAVAREGWKNITSSNFSENDQDVLFIMTVAGWKRSQLLFDVFQSWVNYSGCCWIQMSSIHLKYWKKPHEVTRRYLTGFYLQGQTFTTGLHRCLIEARTWESAPGSVRK